MRRACGARHSGEQFNNAMHICLRFPDCSSREFDMRLVERLLFGNYCLVYIREFFLSSFSSSCVELARSFARYLDTLLCFLFVFPMVLVAKFRKLKTPFSGQRIVCRTKNQVRSSDVLTVPLISFSKSNSLSAILLGLKTLVLLSPSTGISTKIAL